MCSRNEIAFAIDETTGALSLETSEMQEKLMRLIEKELGMSLGLPSKDEMLKREFHGPTPARVRRSVG